MNTPVTSIELQNKKELLNGQRGTLHTSDPNNRNRRRKFEKEGILNNRKITKGRTHPHRVLERMAHFSLSLHAKINKLV